MNIDDMIQLLTAVRESDVVEVEQCSDLFDPRDDLADDAPLTYNEAGKEKLRQAWRKIRNKINCGEPYAKTAAVVRKQLNVAYIHKQWAVT